MKSILGLRGKRMALAAVATFAVAGGIAYAAIPDAGTGVYHACMKKGGAIRIIDPAREHCKASSETEITFNQQGPKGDQGAAGLQGPAGADGEDGADGQDGTDGEPFSGTFTSPNGLYSISVTDSGITLASPDSSINIGASSIMVESLGNDNILVRSARNLDMQSGSGLALTGGSTVTVDSGFGLQLRSGGSTTVDSGGPLTLRGSSVGVNPGGSCFPAARVTDSVSMNIISTGSSTVCVG